MTTTLAHAPEKLDHDTLKDAKHRILFEQVLKDCMRAEGIDRSCHLLVIGASNQDIAMLRRVGFRRITLSNLEEETGKLELPTIEGVELKTVTADVEDLRIADGAYDLVLTHAVLHHCRSPHRALLEMLRVSRRHVIFLEPNDSLVMRAFVKLRFSFPYELSAVIGNGYRVGGVGNTCVPNYIYRWSPRDIYQASASFLAEREFGLYIRRYWDFNVRRRDLELRTGTLIGSFTKILGPGLFLALLRGFQAVANCLPWLSGQGNKFFGCITKQDALKPWLVYEDNRVAFNRSYGK